MMMMTKLSEGDDDDDDDDLYIMVKCLCVCVLRFFLFRQVNFFFKLFLKFLLEF